MRRALTAFALMLALSAEALAGTSIALAPGMTEPQFQQFSADLGAALSYRDLSVAGPLGHRHFSVGINADYTHLAHAASWAAGTRSTANTITLPTLYINKGLPFGLNLGGTYTTIPNSNIRLLGAEVSESLFQGNRRLPAVAVRATYSQLAGVPELSFSTVGVELAFSKSLGSVTPYLGLGRIYVDSRPHVGTLSSQNFVETKTFAGVILHLGTTSVALEGDRIGSSDSITAKFGVRF